MNLIVVPYRGLALQALVLELPVPLGELPSPDWLRDLLRVGAPAPFSPDEGVRTAVRDLLRAHGYRPTGRGKPSSEYLVAAVGDGRLGSINAVVDVGNVVSLHSGLPISVVDLDKTVLPLRVDVPAAGSSYVFNQGGQEIDVGGLLSLFDAQGPCANAVKDAQRTKTCATTRRVVVVVWGVAIGDRSVQAAAWVREIGERLGARHEPVVSG
ncbi:MAG: hypothetical protein IPK26_17795 [Planctomycetes bacterium]|nr:hypothetical protein [Planctomycetota bacterium]